jgi:hypothetical protein
MVWLPSFSLWLSSLEASAEPSPASAVAAVMATMARECSWAVLLQSEK